MEVKNIVSKFVEDLRHAVRQELIRDLASVNGIRIGEEPPREKQASAAKPAKKGKRVMIRNRAVWLDGEPLSPADIISRLPATVEELRKLYGVSAPRVQVTVEELRKQDLIYSTGKARGTTWHRREPLVEIT